MLLDEPLANLDYKLREELRDQLPRLFAGRGAIVVYATSEPSEALMLGGHTATMHEGRVTQFGPTAEVYRAPDDLDHRRRLLRPADQRRPGREARRARSSSSTTSAGRRPAPPPRSPTAATPSASARTSSRRAGPRDGRGAADRHRAHHRALGLGERRPLPGRRRHLGRPVRRRPPLPRRRAAPLLPRRRATASTSPPTAGGSPDGRDPARGAAPRLHRRTRRGPEDYALKEIDLAWQDGGAYALLGPSGCGKTTLLNIISGLVVPSEGRVLFDGRDVTRLAPTERNIAQVFQFPVIYDTMTVYENLAFPLRNRGVAARRHRRPRPRHRRPARARPDARPPRLRPHRPTTSRRSRWAAASSARTSTSSCSTSR